MERFANTSAHALIAASLMFTAACGDRQINDDDKLDVTEPVLTMTSPARGTMSEPLEVRVEGTVSDDGGIVAVTINDETVAVRSDGTFGHTLVLERGLTLIHTVATDLAGNETKDTRSILAGPLSGDGALVADALMADLNSATFEVLSDTVVATLEEMGIEETAIAANPIMGNNDCNGWWVDVKEFNYSNIFLSFSPINDGLAFQAIIYDLDVPMRANWRTVCLGTGANIGFEADSFTVLGRIDFAIDGEEIRVTTEHVTGTFENLDMEYLGVADDIVEFIVNDIDQRVADQIVKPIKETLPQQMEAFINGFLSGDREFTVLGQTLTTLIRPQELDFSSLGANIVLGGRLNVANGDQVPYLTTPMPLPTVLDLPAGKGLRIAVADDLLNQSLASVWGSGAINQSFEVAEDDDLDILGLRIKTADLNLPLPPVAVGQSDGQLKIVAGDVDVKLRNSEGQVTAHLVVSAEVAVAIKVQDGVLGLNLGQPTASVDVLPDAEVANNLDNQALESLVSFAVKQVIGLLEDSVGSIPLPSYAGTEITDPTIEFKSGYLHIGATLSR